MIFERKTNVIVRNQLMAQKNYEFSLSSAVDVSRVEWIINGLSGLQFEYQVHTHRNTFHRNTNRWAFHMPKYFYGFEWVRLTTLSEDKALNSGKAEFLLSEQIVCDRNFSWLLIVAVCKRHMRLCCRWIIKFLFWLLKFINCYARSPMIKREIKCFSHMSSTSCCFHLQFGYKLQAFVFPSIARPEFTLCQFRIRFSLKFACRVDLSNFVLILSHCRQIDEMRCIKCLSRDYVNDLVTNWSVMSTFESD